MILKDKQWRPHAWQCSVVGELFEMFCLTASVVHHFAVFGDKKDYIVLKVRHDNIISTRVFKKLLTKPLTGAGSFSLSGSLVLPHKNYARHGSCPSHLDVIWYIWTGVIA
ncbi:uncharacterized protein LOC114526714 [Dendronephthya gigantea]|uniref:uncharacterized protein LOC114523670 n=1 Tax=Dendronephthya gigantea TaxID=151771 RepID=UPI001069F6A6|nr:uncharacterized protein LOC114523670 [Dendronephthya gigantea]XP_028404055.1 uncharacterized protein LOC114526714 [Dendronephthya gigantea]